MTAFSNSKKTWKQPIFLAVPNISSCKSTKLKDKEGKGLKWLNYLG
ncbi:MAG: hypothetical protein Q9M97_01890 [Candidatus Gracilibacteria bacterium]|nr:hypothetical protein [Candidatus Gracilibacteria bacterium]